MYLGTPLHSAVLLSLSDKNVMWRYQFVEFDEANITDLRGSFLFWCSALS